MTARRIILDRLQDSRGYRLTDAHNVLSLAGKMVFIPTLSDVAAQDLLNSRAVQVEIEKQDDANEGVRGGIFGWKWLNKSIFADKVNNPACCWGMFMPSRRPRSMRRT
jgi:hypothetical protein